MQKDEIKKYIAELLNKGVSLSDIQKQLKSEKGVTMTFLDLRLMVSEIENIDWSKMQPEEKPKEPVKGALPDDEDELMGANDEDAAVGTTVVEVSRLTRPGTVANGSVKFASGIKANWTVDQYGRLGLDKATGEPTPQDVKEFQTELQKMLSHGR